MYLSLALPPLVSFSLSSCGAIADGGSVRRRSALPGGCGHRRHYRRAEPHSTRVSASTYEDGVANLDGVGQVQELF